MPTVILKINNVDFTPNVVQKSYKVQKNDEYSRWVDGNWHQRRDIARTRISGQFNLTFLGHSNYQAFLTAVNAVKANGGYCENVQIWVSSSHELVTTDAFLDLSTKTVWTTEEYGTSPELLSVTVKVTER